MYNRLGEGSMGTIAAFVGFFKTGKIEITTFHKLSMYPSHLLGWCFSGFA